CVRRGLREVPRHEQIQLMHMLPLCLLQRGDEEEVKLMITALQERHAPVALINELNARVLMAKGQWTEAAAILEKTQGMVVGDAFAEAQLNRLVGYCHEKRGEPDRALSAYKQALTADPGLIAAH